MPLYNCKHDGDQFRITKFTYDLDVESSYLCTELECECPAGSRSSCRHRQMLPKFLARGAVGTEWFYNFEHNSWVSGNLPEPEPQYEEPEGLDEGDDTPDPEPDPYTITLDDILKNSTVVDPAPAPTPRLINRRGF